MGAAFGAGVALALVILVSQGTGETGIETALRVTARWAFLFFWPAYAGSAMAALFGPPVQPMAQRGREFGLAFASALLVHVGLIAWLYHISVRMPFSKSTLIIFGTGLFWTYVLTLLSIKRLSAILGARIWRIVRTLGMEYIALAFLLDFARNPFRGSLMNLVAYLPFLFLAVAGPALRLAALALRLTRPRSLAL